MAKRIQPIIAGLDIGTTKVVLVVGVIGENGLDVVGVGTASNTGMRQGVVVNIDATTEAITRAKEEAELMSGYDVGEVWLSISGTHVKSFDSKGMIAIKNQEVSEQDIDRVLEAAKAVAVPTDRDVLHVLPREYKVDEQGGIWDPIGMSGIRLEASVHIVTSGRTASQNAIKCTEKANLKIAGLVLDQLASSLATVSEDEKNLGVALVNMGGGSCGTIVYANGSVAYTSVLPVGGEHFTHDLAVGLRTPQQNAEKLKKKYGCALTEMLNDEEMIDVEGVGGRQSRSILRKNLCSILEPRAEETLELIKKDIVSSGFFKDLGSGIVLTGGASELSGLEEMGEFMFDIPFRLAQPIKVGGLTDVVKSSDYATAIGLLFYGQRQNGVKEERESKLGDGVLGLKRKLFNFLNVME